MTEQHRVEGYSCSSLYMGLRSLPGISEYGGFRNTGKQPLMQKLSSTENYESKGVGAELERKDMACV